MYLTNTMNGYVKKGENNMTPTKELIEQFIVNQLGINLCSVKGITIDRQDDNQIKQIIIDFKPDNSGE